MSRAARCAAAGRLQAGKVKSFPRFSSTIRVSAITEFLHQQPATSPQPRPRRAFSRRGPSVPSHSALRPSHALHQVRKPGCLPKQSGALVPEVRQQARDSGHSPFRGPARGRSPRARISNFALRQHAGRKPSANPSSSAPRLPCRFQPQPLRDLGAKTNVEIGLADPHPMQMLASLRAQSMLNRFAIRRPHARRADHFLTRSSGLAAA